MSHEPTDVLIAAYPSAELASLDHYAVVNAGVEIDGAVVVSRDLQGNVAIEEHTDHLAAAGAKKLGGVGLVVGLFAPPLLLSTAIGAAAGGALGRAASNDVKSEIEEQAERTIPKGGAGLVVAYPRSSALIVDDAVSRASAKVTSEAEGEKVHALKTALAEAERKIGTAD